MSVSFSDPKWPICPAQIFFGTNHYYYFHLPIDPFFYLFTVQNLKKFLQRIQSYEDALFLGRKWSICPKWEFFSENLLMSFVPFIHAYLHAKNQSQIFIY